MPASVKPVRLPILLVVAALLPAACASTKAQIKHATAGSVAPAFDLPGLDGPRVSLAGVAGRVAVIDFWASWCAPCREELPALEKLRTEYEPRGVAFLAINIDDDVDAAREMARKLGVTMAVGLDTDKRVAAAYEPPVMPSSYVVDRQGAIRHVHEGYRGQPDIDRFRTELDALLK